MSTLRSTTKSPLSLVRLALLVGREGLDPYSARRSRHDFTQPQLFAILVLRRFLRMDFRGICQALSDWSDLRAALTLRKVPHWTTLQKAEARLVKRGLTTGCSALWDVADASAA